MDSKKFWLEFFELYKSLPALWKINSAEYKDRTKKLKAYNILVQKCKEILPNADKEFVARKINSFRSTYRRELKKIRLKSNSEDGYEPTLWYFDHLSFLKKLEEEQEEDPLGGLCNEMEFENEDNEDTYIKKSADRSDGQGRPLKVKKKKHWSSNSDELLELATKRLKRCDDYSQTLANVWASEFRLASEEQKFFAKKAIDDILFEARLGTLNRNSVKINENVPNDYAEYNPRSSKRESYQCPSPRSNSVTIEHVRFATQDHDEC